jgi:hypothetical protein
MYNDHLSPEEAKEFVAQRMKEVETYSLQKQLGFGDSTARRWLFLLIVILAVTGIGLLF